RDVAIPLGIGVIAAIAMLLSFFPGMQQIPALLGIIFAILLFPLSRVPVRLAVGLAMAYLVAAVPNLLLPPLDREGNFFGVIKGLDDKTSAPPLLANGSILHGPESTKPESRDEPTSYYHRRGPLGEVMALVGGNLADGAAVIGLGAGTVACYGSQAAPWTFYEINPAVGPVALEPRLLSFPH